MPLHRPLCPVDLDIRDQIAPFIGCALQLQAEATAHGRSGAVRRDQPNDRRVKLVLLTAKGGRLKGELMEAFYAPPPELLTLDSADLTALERLLQQLPRKEGAR